jgi:hypothetical protein
VTTMRAALVTLGPAWEGDKEWTGRYLFSSPESARRYFDRTPRVLEIKPDPDSEYFTPFDETLTRRTK